MITILSHNITSPLGFTSQENFEAILDGKSALRRNISCFGLPEKVCASLFDRDTIESEVAAKGIDSSRYTFFEKIAILSATDAIASAGIDPSSDDVIFIISSTKGNVDYLEVDEYDERCFLSGSAKKIADYFGNPNIPVTVSNACISGLSAQILAERLLLSGQYRTAVVIGADTLSKFIISGFQSFMALSATECRPYDKWRNGLNLGEAAATLVLSRLDANNTGNLTDSADTLVRNADCVADISGVDKSASYRWHLASTSSHNDANHISGPSRTGQGAYLVLKDLIKDCDIDDIAFINAHGTSTLYNDEMESIAIHRAGLDKVPVNGLKGFYGHTLGAAGIVETILSTMALDKGLILPTRGYSEPGTSRELNLDSKLRKTNGRTFIKLLSGFGGSNAGVRFIKTLSPGSADSTEASASQAEKEFKSIDTAAINSAGNGTTGITTKVIDEIIITPTGIKHGDRCEDRTEDSLTELYREKCGNYPKFFKMDNLCKLGFIASEIILSDFPKEEKEECAVILFNRDGSLNTDRNYMKTICDTTNFFPSPATFVYTLANIVTGEIAIRHKIFGETSFYILDKEDAELQKKIVDSTFLTSSPKMILTGWVEYDNSHDYYAHFQLIKPTT